jgi:hypothetical protein
VSDSKIKFRIGTRLSIVYTIKNSLGEFESVHDVGEVIDTSPHTGIATIACQDGSVFAFDPSQQEYQVEVIPQEPRDEMREFWGTNK